MGQLSHVKSIQIPNCEWSLQVQKEESGLGNHAAWRIITALTCYVLQISSQISSSVKLKNIMH